MNDQYFCMAPFTHLSVDAQSRIRPCCMFYPTIYNEKYTKLNDIFIGNENKILRDKMLNGERIDGCNKCYIDETIGKKSYRQLFNERYLNEKNIQYPKIRELELALGNKCNLKCVTCNGYYSSAWEKEDILLSKILPRKITINKNIENIMNVFCQVVSEMKNFDAIGNTNIPKPPQAVTNPAAFVLFSFGKCLVT